MLWHTHGTYFQINVLDGLRFFSYKPQQGCWSSPGSTEPTWRQHVPWARLSEPVSPHTAWAEPTGLAQDFRSAMLSLSRGHGHAATPLWPMLYPHSHASRLASSSSSHLQHQSFKDAFHEPQNQPGPRRHALKVTGILRCTTAIIWLVLSFRRDCRLWGQELCVLSQAPFTVPGGMPGTRGSNMCWMHRWVAWAADWQPDSHYHLLTPCGPGQTAGWGLTGKGPPCPTLPFSLCLPVCHLVSDTSPPLPEGTVTLNAVSRSAKDVWHILCTEHRIL